MSDASDKANGCTAMPMSVLPFRMTNADRRLSHMTRHLPLLKRHSSVHSPMPPPSRHFHEQFAASVCQPGCGGCAVPCGAPAALAPHDSSARAKVVLIIVPTNPQASRPAALSHAYGRPLSQVRHLCLPSIAPVRKGTTYPGMRSMLAA